MSTITTVAVLPPAVREYYDRLLLMTAYPTLVHVKMAQKRVEFARLKLNLIDLESLTDSADGDRGEPIWDAERLSGLAA